VPCDIKCHGLGSVPGEGKGSADRLDVKVGKLILITSHVTYQYGPASEEGGNFYKCLLSTFNLYLSLLLAKEPHLSAVSYSLGAFTKLLKAAINVVVFFCSSVRPSVEQLGSHWTDFHEILYFSIFRKSVRV
jgi:hypothetical protein